MSLVLLFTITYALLERPTSFVSSEEKWKCTRKLILSEFVGHAQHITCEYLETTRDSLESTQEESHSGGTAVEIYTTVTLLSTQMSQQ